MIMYVGHMVSLSLYVFVVMAAVACGWTLMHRKLPISTTAKVLIGVFSFSLTAQASLFVALQIDWIWMDYNTAVGDLTAYAWLAFDYFNGFALLSFATLVNIFLRWRCE